MAFTPVREMQVIPLSDIQIGAELGRGAYGIVFKVKYLGVYYAAKQIHSVLLEYGFSRERNPIIDNFVHEIKLCSTLSHPNIVQYRGIYYDDSEQLRSGVPIMLMELMDNSLTHYLRGQPYVSSTTKMSILHDVSLGLYYLHSQKPPIIHRDLSPNNVMIKSNFPHPVAKISDLGVARSFKVDNQMTMTRAPGTLPFMPPECLHQNPQYGTPMDVFSYGGVALFVINQEWPEPTAPVRFDPQKNQLYAFSEVDRRHRYLNFQDGPVKQIIVACLSNDPGARPSARRIEAFMSSFKIKGEEVLAQATQIILPAQLKDKTEKVHNS